MSTYGYTNRTDDYANGEIPLAQKKLLHKTVRTEFQRYKKKYGLRVPIIFMGDLQDTMTTSNADNEGSYRAKMNKKSGLLHLALQYNMLSLTFESRGNTKYLTRRGKAKIPEQEVWIISWLIHQHKICTRNLEWTD